MQTPYIRALSGRFSVASLTSRRLLDVIDPDGGIGPSLIRGFAKAHFLRGLNKDLKQSRRSDLFFNPLFLHKGRFSLTKLASVAWQLRHHMKGTLEIDNDIYQLTKSQLENLPITRMSEDYFHRRNRPALVQQLLYDFMRLPPELTRRVLVTAGIKPMARQISDMIGAKPDYLIATEVVEEFSDGRLRVKDIQGGLENVPYGPVKRKHIRSRFQETERETEFEPGTFYFSSLDALWVAFDPETKWKKLVLLDPSEDLVRAITALKRAAREETRSLRYKIIRSHHLPPKPALIFLREGGMDRPIEILKGGLFHGKRGVWSEEKGGFVYEKIPSPPWVRHFKELSRIRFNPPRTYAELHQPIDGYGSFFELAAEKKISPSQLVFVMDMDMSDFQDGKTAETLPDFFRGIRQSNAFSIYTDSVGLRTFFSNFGNYLRLGERVRGMPFVADPREHFYKLQVLLTVRDMFRRETPEDQNRMIEMADNLAVYRDETGSETGEERKKTIDDEVVELARHLGVNDLDNEEAVKRLEKMTEAEFVERFGRMFGIQYFHENEILDGEKAPEDKLGFRILPAASQETISRLPVFEPPDKMQFGKEFFQTATKEAVYGAGPMAGAMLIAGGGTAFLPNTFLMAATAAVSSIVIRGPLGHHPVVRSLYTAASFTLADLLEDWHYDGAAVGIGYNPWAVMAASAAADAAFGLVNLAARKKPLVVKTEDWGATLIKGTAHAAATIAILHALQVFF